MARIMKAGKVVVILRGKFAGRKAVIVKTFESGTTSHKFSHALVVGINKYPKKVTKKMSVKAVENRSKVRPFVKLVNYNHIMPTRYAVDLEVKNLKYTSKEGETEEVTLDENIVSDPAKKKTACKALKVVLEKQYKEQDSQKTPKAVEGAKFLYQRLRF